MEQCYVLYVDKFFIIITACRTCSSVKYEILKAKFPNICSTIWDVQVIILDSFRLRNSKKCANEPDTVLVISVFIKRKYATAKLLLSKVNARSICEYLNTNFLNGR
jgi:hypothetical protein